MDFVTKSGNKCKEKKRKKKEGNVKHEKRRLSIETHTICVIFIGNLKYSAFIKNYAYDYYQPFTDHQYTTTFTTTTITIYSYFNIYQSIKYIVTSNDT